MSIKNQILAQVEELFFRFGIKSVTMEDIARTLGISKKTLYQFVENKADLIEQIFLDSMDKQRESMARLHRESGNAIDELLKIADFAVRQMMRKTPGVLYDLQKYYPAAWKRMETIHQGLVYSILVENMKWGIRQGIFRDDIDVDIAAKLFVSNLSKLTDREAFPLEKYNQGQLIQFLVLYHLRGIATPKGLALLELNHPEKN